MLFLVLFLNLPAKVIFFFLFTSILPNFFALACKKIQLFGQNEEIIAQSVDVLLHFGRYGGLFCEGYDATLSTTTDGAADMRLGCLLRTSWEDETLAFGEFVHDAVDLVFQFLDGSFGQMGRRVEGRLVLVSSQVGAHVEQVVLDALHEGLLVAFWKHGGKESEVGVEFIDGAISLQTDAGLRNALTTYE